MKAAFSKAWSQADDFEKDLAKELEEPAEVPAEASKKRAADAGGPTAKRTPPAEEVAAISEGGRSQSRGKKKLRKQGDLYLLYIYIYINYFLIR